MDLGLDPEYFWALTLREFSILHRRHQVERYRTSAHVCAFLAEMYRDPAKRDTSFMIEEFLPGHETVPKESPEDRINAGRMAFERERMLTSILGWEDKTVGINIQIMDV